MTKSLGILTLLLASLVRISSAHAQAADWISLTGKSKQTCTLAFPCYAKEMKAEKLIKITFTIEKSDELATIQSIEINGDRPEKKSTYSLIDMAGILAGEEQGLYSADLNSDGHLDLILQATTTAKGPLFYYFIQDPKTGRFIQTPDPLPELRKGKKGALTSPFDDRAFKISKDLKIQASTKSK